MKKNAVKAERNCSLHFPLISDFQLNQMTSKTAAWDIGLKIFTLQVQSLLRALQSCVLGKTAHCNIVPFLADTKTVQKLEQAITFEQFLILFFFEMKIKIRKT